MSGAQSSKHRLCRPDLAAEILLDLVKQRVEETRQARAIALVRPRRTPLPLSLGLVALFLGRETGGNKSTAAKRLGLTRTQLYVRLRKYDLEKPTSR